jgi:hypothetical protein
MLDPSPDGDVVDLTALVTIGEELLPGQQSSREARWM